MARSPSRLVSPLRAFDLEGVAEEKEDLAAARLRAASAGKREQLIGPSARLYDRVFHLVLRRGGIGIPARPEDPRKLLAIVRVREAPVERFFVREDQEVHLPQEASRVLVELCRLGRANDEGGGSEQEKTDQGPHRPELSPTVLRLVFFSCFSLRSLILWALPGGWQLKTVAPIDYGVIAVYMLLMLGIGVYSMRFNRGAADYFKGGNRIHWLAAGLSSFMSGFSAWTFTGASGLAYQHGLVTVLLYVGNACTFLLGYFVFAVRWRRARISTVMEYLVERFDERTRQTFSWSTIFFQFFTGGSMLYGLALFVAPACGWPLSWTIVGSGAVILAYCVVGGLWAVVITDFLQAAILMPFTLVMGFAALSRVGGLHGLVTSLPPEMTSLRLPGEYGWSYVLCWSVMVSFGYNTAAMAQRYFSVDDETSTRKVALLCFGLFLVGSAIWFLPPLAMRVLQPDLTAVWPGLKNPHESSYALAALTFLPNGLVGIMLAAMFSATMSSISGLLNVHASIISKDIFPALFPSRAGESEKLAVGWIATLGVGIVITAVALVMAGSGASVFKYMVEFNTVMSLAYGPPALLGLVVRRTPRSSGLLSFAVGLVLGSYVTFWAKSGLVATVLIVVPASVAAFFLSRWLEADDPGHSTRREAFFERLDTPVDVARELRDAPDPTAQVFRFLSRSTGLVGLASLLVLFSAGPEDRGTVIGYVALTLALAAGLSFVRGGSPLTAARESAP